jgi:hypothetical protein
LQLSSPFLYCFWLARHPHVFLVFYYNLGESIIEIEHSEHTVLLQKPYNMKIQGVIAPVLSTSKAPAPARGVNLNPSPEPNPEPQKTSSAEEKRSPRLLQPPATLEANNYTNFQVCSTRFSVWLIEKS